MVLPAVVALCAKRIQGGEGGFREDSGRAEYVRRVVTNHSLISPYSLPARIVAAILHTHFVIPHTNLVILSVAKNLVIGVIVSLLLPDPSTPLRFAQDDKGEEFSGSFREGGVR